MSDITKLKYQVEMCLRDFPSTRNSDVALTIKVWERFYPQHITINEIGEKFVYLDSLFDLPREDNVKRIRAKFNECGQYVTLDLTVAKKRGMSEAEWRHALQYWGKKFQPEVSEVKTDAVSSAEFLQTTIF